MMHISPFKKNPDLTQAIIELESSIVLVTGDSGATKQTLKLIESLINSHRHDFGEHSTELLQRVKDFKSGSSRFEWIDSVLVSQIEQGGWAVFENANLCNPSILDRLNSLLEEGNFQMSINEQGLVNGEQIRVVKANKNFRSIFIMAERTLNEQGKDVSRALRNRCQELRFNFNEDQQYDDLGVGS